MFFDRVTDCAAIWEIVKNNKNILMLAPRRVGKTFLLHRLKEQAPANGYRAVVFEVAGFTDEKKFLQTFCSAIQDELGTSVCLSSLIKQRLSHFCKGGDADNWQQLLLRADWPEFAESLLKVLEEKKETRWFIMIDEIAIFVRELVRSGPKGRAHTFLYWLRNMQQKYKSIRWLYSGSIGLDSVARREDIEGALVDMKIYPLAPFDGPAAKNYVELIAERKGYRFQPDAVSNVLDTIGWLSPYYLELLAEKACIYKDDTGTVSSEAVNSASADLLDLKHRTYWSTWREHITKNFDDPERSHLFGILEIAALNLPSVSRDTLLNNIQAKTFQGTIDAKTLGSLLDTLESDGFLAPCGDTRRAYRFRLPLLGRWWLRHVVREDV